MPTDTLYEKAIHPSDNDNAAPILSVMAQRHRVMPIVLTSGTRQRMMLTAREALALAASLVDAVQSLKP